MKDTLQHRPTLSARQGINCLYNNELGDVFLIDTNMKQIEEWLENFRVAWKTHDIEKVIGLFSDNVEYWETPFVKMASIDALKKEWEYVGSQKNISLRTEVFSAIDNKYSVEWFLTYENKENEVKEFGGVYLIELNEHDKCCYFFHCGESKI